MASQAHEFDAATAVAPSGEGRWTGEISDGWDIASVANGGYVMSVGVSALLRETGREDPLSVTAYYLAPTKPGKVEMVISTVRESRRMTMATASMVQNDTEITRLLATMGSLEEDPGSPSYSISGPIELLPPENCVRPMPIGDFRPPPITERVELAIEPSTTGFALNQPSGTAEMKGWSRFADGRPPDSLSLPLFADAFPPPVFNAGLPLSWVPTIEFTVQVRKRPAPGWLANLFRTRLVRGGYLDEEGEIYDSEGDLVALSRQFAKAPRSR